jgi:hypothetical protein
VAAPIACREFTGAIVGIADRLGDLRAGSARPIVDRIHFGERHVNAAPDHGPRVVGGGRTGSAQPDAGVAEAQLGVNDGMSAPDEFLLLEPMDADQPLDRRRTVAVEEHRVDGCVL